MKAERTRTAILEAALDLFSEQGFDPTTMEQIAARAEVGIATLYRYFPTKDGILSTPWCRLRVCSPNCWPPALPTSPSTKPCHALDTYLPSTTATSAAADLLDAARSSARLWDLWAQERGLLEGHRRRTSARPATCSGIAAHTAMMILDMALDLQRSATPACTAEQAARDIIGLLARNGALIPRLPSDRR